MSLSNNSHLIKHSDRNMMLLFGKLQHHSLLPYYFSISSLLPLAYQFISSLCTKGHMIHLQEARKNRYALLHLRKIEYVCHEMPCLPLNHCQFLTFPALECLHQHSIIKASAHCLHKKMYHLTVRMMDYPIPIGQGKFQATI